MQDYWHDTCPRCGGFKYHTSKLCLKCRSAQNATKKTRQKKDACPRCGGPKLVTAKLCCRCATGMDIELAEYRGRHKADLPSPRWERVSRDWLVQFAGIVLSEGCLHTRLSPGGTLSLSLVIKLRIDDIACLQAIQERLGGSVKTYAARDHAPEAVWTVTKLPDVGAILQAIRPLVVIPMRKAAEFDIALEYIAWRGSVGFHHVDRARISEFFERLKVAKQLAE